MHAAAEKRDDGRYRAILIDAEAYFLSVVRYIHRNPAGGGSVRYGSVPVEQSLGVSEQETMPKVAQCGIGHVAV